MLKVNDATFGDSARYAALVIFFVMAFSDVLDGYMARRKKQSTRLGSFLDPTADKLLITCACLLLTSRRAGVAGFCLPPTVVVLIISKDMLLLLGFIIVYFVTFQVCIQPVFVGKLATTLQLSMVAAVLVGPELSSILPLWWWLARGIWWSAAGAAVLAALVYIRKGMYYIEQFEQKSMGNKNAA
jgi:cardiolipin synthase